MLFVVACGFAVVLVAAAGAFVAHWPLLVFLFLVPQTLGVMGSLATRGLRTSWPAVLLVLASGLVTWLGAGWLVPALQLVGAAIDLAVRRLEPSPRPDENGAREPLDVRPSDAD